MSLPSEIWWYSSFTICTTHKSISSQKTPKLRLGSGWISDLTSFSHIQNRVEDLSLGFLQNYLTAWIRLCKSFKSFCCHLDHWPINPEAYSEPCQHLRWKIYRNALHLKCLSSIWLRLCVFQFFAVSASASIS